MKKSRLLILLYVIMLSIVLLVLSGCGVRSYGFIFKYNPDGTCALDRALLKTGDVVIPSTAPNGASVTEIGSSAFRDCSGLTSVTIPDSVTSIGDDAFSYCSGLTSVTIPDSVTSIGDRAFLDCSGLTSVTIPDSVTSIGDGAFLNCLSVEAVVIGKGLATVGEGAFATGKKLVSIKLSEENRYYKSIDGNLYTNNGKTLVKCAVGRTDNTFRIPRTVEEIAPYAFYASDNIKTMVIPANVTKIGKYAFYNCWHLTSVTMENVDGWGYFVNEGDMVGKLIPSYEFETPSAAAESLTSSYARGYANYDLIFK